MEIETKNFQNLNFLLKECRITLLNIFITKWNNYNKSN